MTQQPSAEGIQRSLFDQTKPAMPHGIWVPTLTADRPNRSGSAAVEYVDSASVLTPGAGFTKRFKFTLNPYSGCRFACEYCYARFFAPSVEDQEAWGEWVRVKQNAVDLIERAKRSRVAARRLESGDAIYMSSVTDPYQPVERKIGLTRAILEALLPVQPRLTIQTRSPIVTRDIDLLRQFRRIRVNFTVTTDWEEMRLRYEPHCPANEVRLEAAQELVTAGVPIGISISPMLPMRDPATFGRRIAALNAAEYVTQFFKPTRSRFSAGSTAAALAKMREDGWTDQRYEAARVAIQRALGPDKPLLRDAEGYAPVPEHNEPVEQLHQAGMEKHSTARG